MFARFKGRGSTTCNPALLDELAKCVPKTSECNGAPNKGDWFTQAVVANKRMASEFFDAREGLKAECLTGTITAYDDDDDTVKKQTDDERDDFESCYDFPSMKGTLPFECAPVQPKCRMDDPFKTAPWQTSCLMLDQSDKPILERRDDGIDFIFELVESTFCGGQHVLNKRPNGGKGITFDDLPTYNMPQELLKDSLAEDELVSRAGQSTRTHRTSSTRSRSVTSHRSDSRKSRSRRKSLGDRDTPAWDRNRSSGTRSEEDKMKDMMADKIAKTATAYIRENGLEQARLDAEREMSEYRRKKGQKLKSVLKTKSTLKPDKCSAFKDLPPDAEKVPTVSTVESSAITSRPTGTGDGSPLSNMRELCVLNIVSGGSSVSSFGEGRSWSHHTTRSLLDSTPRASKKVATSPSVPEVDESTQNFYRTMKTLVNFVHSFSTDLYGEGGAAPVNKAVCFLSLAMIVFFWPEDQEKNRVKIEKKEIPKKTKRESLLTLVTRG